LTVLHDAKGQISVLINLDEMGDAFVIERLQDLHFIVELSGPVVVRHIVETDDFGCVIFAGDQINHFNHSTGAAFCDGLCDLAISKLGWNIQWNRFSG
jgi:hypothetical protein